MTRTNDPGDATLCPAPVCDLGESLIWDETLGAFWWVDVHSGVLYRGTLDGGDAQRWQFGEALGHVALTDRPHTVVLGLASGLVLFDAGSGASTRLVDIPHAAAAMRVNDGRCDRHGNLVFGTMSADGQGPRGGFWWFSARDGLHSLALPAPAIPNSICFSPDGYRLYFTDSSLRIIQTCDYEPATGEVGAVRPFADPGAVPWEPDGSCVDADGGVWNARWGGASLARYLPSGALERIVVSPARQPTCPCLGGSGFDMLYATSARRGIATEQQSGADGVIMAWRLPGLKGLPEGRVRGL